MTEPHARLITAAARKYLRPLGCIQQGRSRTWLLDRKWFVSVVEFQPSSYGKGSFLNVGAHFLWSWNDHISFDLGHRLEEFKQFEDEAQFEKVAEDLALRAVKELNAIDARLPSPSAASRVVPKSTGLSLWPRYHRAVSHGLAGESVEALKLFESLTARTPSADWELVLLDYCKRLASVVENSTAFGAQIAELIAEHRSKLRMQDLPQMSLLAST